LTACGGGGGGSKSSSPQILSELTGTRLSVKPIVEKITKILVDPSLTIRTSTNNISISDKLKNVSNGEKINNLIPSNSRNEFWEGLGPNGEKEWIQNTKYLIGSDNTSWNNLVIGTCDKYEQNQRYIVSLFEGKEGDGTIVTKVVTMPNESAAVALSYLNDGNGNQSTFAFVIKKNADFEGRIFKGHKNNVAYDSENYDSLVFGNKTQMTYQNKDTIEVVKIDGTPVSSTSPEIEGFKSTLYALKFAGQLRTGEDGESNSPFIYENKLTSLPTPLANLSNGEVLDEYMKYLAIEDFDRDSSIIYKFMPDDLEDYENVRIGDYNGSLKHYSGALATPTLRLALSVIDKDTTKIVTKVAGQDNGLYIVAVSYLTINNKEYTVAIGAQMIRDSEGVFLEAKMFEGKRTDVSYFTQNDKGEIGTAKVEYKSETEIPVTITVNGKTVTENAATK
jgi:hypothetical protein